MDSTDPASVKFAPNIQYNQKSLQHIYDVTSLAAGVGAGVLRLESWGGFLFYFVVLSLTNLIYFFVVAGGLSQSRQFYENPLKQIFLDGLLPNLAGYIMMWCLVYTLIDF